MRLGTVRERDRNLLDGLVPLFILVTLVVSTLADILIAALDPWVRDATVLPR